MEIKPRIPKHFSERIKFLWRAPDGHYLLHKDALTFAIARALRRKELYKMKCEDKENGLNSIKMYTKYKTQRAVNIGTVHFFLQYRMENAKPRLKVITSKIPKNTKTRPVMHFGGLRHLYGWIPKAIYFS